MTDKIIEKCFTVPVKEVRNALLQYRVISALKDIQAEAAKETPDTSAIIASAVAGRRYFERLMEQDND